MTFKSTIKIPIIILLAWSLVACDLHFIAKEDDSPINANSSVYSLLQLQRNPDDALNIVFIPDSSYGNMNVLANRQAFIDDLANLIDTGYWQNQGYVNNLHLFNYYYMTTSGTAASPADPNDCPDVTWPNEVNTDAAFADLVLLVHSNVLRDCRWGRLATTEPTSYRTAVHETSHALFNLPDEYCCDGGYREVKPVMYDTRNECITDAVNAPWRDCNRIDSVRDTDGDGVNDVWWRSERPQDIMGRVSGVAEFGEADWVVVRDVLDDLGRVNDPTVYAPDAWAWTP